MRYSGNNHDDWNRYYERERAMQNAGSAGCGILGLFALVLAFLAPDGLNMIFLGGGLACAFLSKLFYHREYDE